VGSPWIRSTATFAVLHALAVAPLGLQIAKRRARDAGLAALTGAVLLVEARWLGGSVGLQVLGTLLLVASAATSTTRPAPPAPALIRIERRDESCAGAVAAYNRDDCPGTKVCPVTGQLICVDRCPAQK
jgi:hypothetical protein